MEDSREESKVAMHLDSPADELFKPLTSLDTSEKWHFQHAVLKVQEKYNHEGMRKVFD